MAAQNFGVDFDKISSADPNHAQEWRRGMDIARIELDKAVLKREFLIWAEANEVADLEHFVALEDWRYITVGRAAWLMNNGAEIPTESSEFFVNQLELLRKIKPEVAAAKEDADEERPLTAEGRRIIQYVNYYSFIDAVRTKFAEDHDEIEEMITKRLKDTLAPMAMLRKLYQHYKELLKEAISERDNQYVAATVEPLVVVVNTLAAMTGNATAMSASKKKISARTAKAISKAKVKNIDTTNNIVGLSPALMIGTTGALLFNTKNRKAILYVAKTDETLGVKGTYITGFDEKASFGKTLRKPKETFTKILHNANPKRINEVLGNYIKGKRHSANGKLNSDTIIVKVFK